MDTYKETFETWNKVASVYQDKFMNLDYYNESYDFVCDAIQKADANLLEIGCGPGNITKYLLSRRPEWNVTGVDISPNMIELARKNNPKAHFKVMDARAIAEFGSKYDGIICGFCLPYLSPKDAEKFLADSGNLLHYDGILYLSFVEGKTVESSFKTSKTGDRVYFNYYHLDELVQKLEELKFSNLKTIKVQYPISETESEEHTILIVKKN